MCWPHSQNLPARRGAVAAGKHISNGQSWHTGTAIVSIGLRIEPLKGKVLAIYKSCRNGHLEDMFPSCSDQASSTPTSTCTNDLRFQSPLRMAGDSFFARFPKFDYDPTAAITSEFKRLALESRWSVCNKRDIKKYYKKRDDCLFSAFSDCVGSAGNTKLERFQVLCGELDLVPVPKTITGCKKVWGVDIYVERNTTTGSVKTDLTSQVLRGVNINIIDLIDARRAGTKVKKWPSKRALREYTVRTDKRFPLNVAKRDGILSALLIELL